MAWCCRRILFGTYLFSALRERLAGGDVPPFKGASIAMYRWLNVLAFWAFTWFGEVLCH